MPRRAADDEKVLKPVLILQEVLRGKRSSSKRSSNAVQRVSATRSVHAMSAGMLSAKAHAPQSFSQVLCLQTTLVSHQVLPANIETKFRRRAQMIETDVTDVV